MMSIVEGGGGVLTPQIGRPLQTDLELALRSVGAVVLTAALAADAGDAIHLGLQDRGCLQLKANV